MVGVITVVLRIQVLCYVSCLTLKMEALYTSEMLVTLPVDMV
jgi:hypothetical protein